MNVGNNQKIEEGLYNKNEKNLLALTYFQKNFTNLNKIKNLYLQNNSMNDNFNSINNLSNISKKTNNEINSDEMAKIVNSSQENPQNQNLIEKDKHNSKEKKISEDEEEVESKKDDLSKKNGKIIDEEDIPIDLSHNLSNNIFPYTQNSNGNNNQNSFM